jgi:hypothetical protein
MESFYDITEKSESTVFEQELIPTMQYGVRQENRNPDRIQKPKFIVIHEVSLCPDNQGFMMTYEEFINFWKQINAVRGRFTKLNLEKLDFDDGMVMQIPKSPSSYDLEYYHQKIVNDGINGTGAARKVGYHYLVTDDRVVQFIPDNEVALHTGSEFNYHSIGVERIICEGTSYPDALHNQAKLIATLMVKYDIPIERVICHADARVITGRDVKYCPGRLISGYYGGLERFFQEIELCIKNNDLFAEVIYDGRLVPDDKQIILYQEGEGRGR